MEGEEGEDAHVKVTDDRLTDVKPYAKYLVINLLVTRSPHIKRDGKMKWCRDPADIDAKVRNEVTLEKANDKSTMCSVKCHLISNGNVWKVRCVHVCVFVKGLK